MMEGERRSSKDQNGDSLTKATPAKTKQDEITSTVGGDDVESQYTALLQCSGNVEKRVAVDRRKLERLIIAGKDNETAPQYFQRVMETSDTLILWPSRLTIGAKSKKDPQVKIAGTPENVIKAKEMLLNDLDTKRNRVTLKINIAYGEHSHVIGREGANIKKVHSETQCHIHFPDTNRFSQGEKSDQVSITGLYPAVEIARKRVRELQPLVVSFSLPLHSHVNVDHNSADMINISQTYNVNISIKPQSQLMSMSVTVKGTMRFVEGLKLAVAKLVEYFTGDVHFIPPVVLFTDIAQQHHRTIMGREGGNLQGIMHETCTTIQMPDSQNYYRGSQVAISGPLDNTLEARNRLMGCLPVALLFDVTDDEGSITDAYIGDLMSKLDVFLSVKSKAKQTVQCVIVKSIEQNMECVYEARRLLCDYASQLVPTYSKGGATPFFQQQGGATPFSQQQRSEIVKQPITEVSNDTELAESKPTTIESDLTSTSPEYHPSTTSPTPLVSSVATTDTTKVELSDSVTIIPPTTPVSVSPKPVNISPKPGSPEMSGMLGSISELGKPSRLTASAMINYEKKKMQAEIALQKTVDPNIKRYPTSKFAGSFLSSSMPQQPKETPPGSVTSGPVAKGLESLQRSSFQALLTQADDERKRSITQKQNAYEDITDLSTLLSHLDLEKYESNFAEEEIDFETFLTMSESDLKEVGVATLGARRKLQIAINAIKKLRQQQSDQKTSGPPHRPSLVPSRLSGANPGPSRSMIGSSNSRSVRLAPGHINMSRSVRF